MEETSPDELERLFQSNLSDLEVSPSDKVWKEIERRLDKKPRRRFFWIFFFGILLIGGGGYGIYKSDFFKNESGIVAVNNSNEEENKNAKNVQIKNNRDAQPYNNTNENRKKDQAGNDTSQAISKPQRVYVADSININSNLNSNTNEIPDQRIILNKKNKIKAQPVANSSTKNTQISVKENSDALNKLTVNKSSANTSAGNNNDANSKKIVAEAISSSDSSSQKINNQGTAIVKDQDDASVKINPTNQNGDLYKGKDQNDTIVKTNLTNQNGNTPNENPDKAKGQSSNKNQANNKAQPYADTIRRNETNMSLEQDTQSVAKEELVLKGQSPSFIAGATISSPDSLKNKEENLAALKKDSTSEKKKEKKKSKFSVAAFYSPDINKPSLSNRPANSSASYSFTNSSNPQNTFSEGLVVGYDQTNRLRWQAALSYTELIQSTDAANFKFNWHDNLSFNFTNSFGSLQLNSTQFSKNDNSSGFPSDTIHIRYDTKETLGYIKLPVVFNYKLITGRFSLYTIASVTGIVEVKNKMEFHVLNASSGKVISSEMSGIRKMNVGLMGGLGGQLNLFRGLYIFAEPNLKASLFAINRRTSLKYVPFSLSISAGLGFHF